jgi:hypothetical protein
LDNPLFLLKRGEREKEKGSAFSMEDPAELMALVYLLR